MSGDRRVRLPYLVYTLFQAQETRVRYLQLLFPCLLLFSFIPFLSFSPSFSFFLSLSVSDSHVVSTLPPLFSRLPLPLFSTTIFYSPKERTTRVITGENRESLVEGNRRFEVCVFVYLEADWPRDSDTSKGRRKPSRSKNTSVVGVFP